MIEFLQGFCFTTWQVFGLVSACMGVVFSFLNVVVQLGVCSRNRKALKSLAVWGFEYE